MINKPKTVRAFIFSCGHMEKEPFDTTKVECTFCRERRSENEGGDKVKRTIMVNADDGEIVGEINPGDRIMRRESIKYLADTVEWGKGRPFIKVFADYFPRVMIGMSGGAVGIMHLLSTYIAYGSNLLCNRTTNNPLNHQDIEEITNLSNKTVIKFMDELVKHKVVSRVKVGYGYQYYANPYIYCRGSRINKTLETMFQDYPEKYR